MKMIPSALEVLYLIDSHFLIALHVCKGGKDVTDDMA